MKPVVVLFGVDAPTYAKLTWMTGEMTWQDVLVVVGTAFVVVTPHMFVPFIRLG